MTTLIKARCYAQAWADESREPRGLTQSKNGQWLVARADAPGVKEVLQPSAARWVENGRWHYGAYPGGEMGRPE